MRPHRGKQPGEKHDPGMGQATCSIPGIFPPKHRPNIFKKISRIFLETPDKIAVNFQLNASR
jgi:hypothetical protein